MLEFRYFKRIDTIMDMTAGAGREGLEKITGTGKGIYE